MIKVEHYKRSGRDILFNDHWEFILDDKMDYKVPQYNEHSFTAVTLPHDWSIKFNFNHHSPAQNEAGLLDGGIAWYRKNFTIDKALNNKKTIIHFGGVYMDSDFYVNGNFVGNMPNGYVPFSYDITEYLYTDGRMNTIAMRVTNQQPSSRWYSGSGIYRDVHLDILDELHFVHHQTVINYTEQDTSIRTNISTQLSKDDKNAIFHLVLKEKNGPLVHEQAFNASSPIEFDLENLKLWSVDHPNLYTLTLYLYKEHKQVDKIEIQFGYRFLNWDSNTGFSLNNQPLKFHGVCIHHDNGALGSVAYKDAISRKLHILKDMGVNAIRSAHNPIDDHSIQIAEEIGLMIIDEAFDTWYGGKKEYDYGRFFEQKATHPDAQNNETWAEFDIKAMVRRGINSPAIIMWSLGNEIGESNDGSEKAVQTVRNLNKWVKEVDTTRFTTMGQDIYRGIPSGPHEKISAEVDAVGLNYGEKSFEIIRQNHPDWLIYGSETASGTSSRGEYAYPDQTVSHDDKPNRHFQQSDYGNDHVGWGNTVENCWLFDKPRPDYAGQFFWTGFDYIGEPTPWHNQNLTPAKSSYFGIVDTAGFPKNDYYMLQSQWTHKPMLHIYPHWNWEDLKENELMHTKDGKIPVRVVSNQFEVELFLNGTSYGKLRQNEDEVYRQWRLDYEPGEVKAIAYDEQGDIVLEKSIHTATSASSIHISKDQYSNDTLDYLVVSLKDEAANHCPRADHLIHFELQGNAKIIGVDNGNPSSLEKYQMESWSRKLFNGYALVIIQKAHKEARYNLKASSENLESFNYRPFESLETDQTLSIELDIQEAVKGTCSPFKVRYTYGDLELDEKILDVKIKMENASSSLIDGMIHFHQEGQVALTIEVPSYQTTKTFTLKVEDTKDMPKLSKIHHTVLVLEKNETLSETYPVLVEFENGYKKVVDYKLEESVDTTQLGRSFVKASIEELDCVFDVEVSVEGYLEAQDFDIVKLPGDLLRAPKVASVKHSDGSSNYKNIVWDHTEGIIEGTDLKTKINIIETTNRIDGTNLARTWTGSRLPLAISSKPSNIEVSRINNGNSERQNPYHMSHKVGVIFGDAGDLTLRYVDNIILQADTIKDMASIKAKYYPHSLDEIPSEMEAFLDDFIDFEDIQVSYNDEHDFYRIDVSPEVASAILIEHEEIKLYQIIVHEAYVIYEK